MNAYLDYSESNYFEIPMLVRSSWSDKPDADVMCMSITETSIGMLVSYKYFILSSLQSSQTMLALRRMSRCCRSRLTVSTVLSCRPLGPPTATTRTGLLSSQNRLSFHVPAHRCEAHLNSYRDFSTTSSIRSDAIGKIQSTHYHLIYTCKVPLPVLWETNILVLFCVAFWSGVLLAGCLCRFALTDQWRRYPSRLTTKV